MVQFNKLRLQGFKSFVEQTELSIDPGMTGIVGPNGCGKSNLVEALRWVMGETSARRMRGGETLGVNSTPTLFVNGQEFKGARTVEEMDATFSKLAK